MPLFLLLIVAGFCVVGEPKFCDDWRHSGDTACRPAMHDQEVVSPPRPTFAEGGRSSAPQALGPARPEGNGAPQ